MTDADLRGLILQGFYNCRAQRTRMGVGIDGLLKFQLQGVSETEILRVCSELQESGLINWKTVMDSVGNPALGFGEINASGIDVFEGTMTPPLPISVGQCTYKQIGISGSDLKVPVPDADARQQQETSRSLSILIDKIGRANASETGKEEAKELLAKFLQTDVAAAIVGLGIKGLLKACER